MLNAGTPFDAAAVARDLAADFATRADEADRQGQLPPEDLRALRASGYLAMAVPREFGGHDLPLRDCLAAQIALAQGSGATALVAGMTLQLFGYEREMQLWPPEVYADFCRAIVEDGALFNSVASEPVLGSPSRGGAFSTTATRAPDGAHWIINGHKNWITGGAHLTHLLVRLMVDDAPGVILVEGGTPGLEWRETWREALSFRASESHDLLFHDVCVPLDHLIERAEEGAPRLQPNAWFPMVMAAGYLGTAIAARDAVIRYALERVPTSLGRPIATLPKIQRQIGELDVPLEAARTLLLDAAADWRGDEASYRQVYPRMVAAKHLVTETANTVTEKALQIAGGISLTRALPLERYFRDVRAGSMQPPSGDTALEFVGRHAVEQAAEALGVTLPR